MPAQLADENDPVQGPMHADCGDAAFLVEPTEPERIFEATRRLLGEAELAEDLVAKGRARAREFTWRECAKSTLLAYQAAQDQGDDEPKMGGLF